MNSSGKRSKGYSEVGRRGVVVREVIEVRGKGYSAVGRRGVSGNGVIEARGIVQ